MPFCLIFVLALYNLFAAYCTYVLLMLQYELFGLFDMAVTTEKAVDVPFFVWLVLVPTKLLIAYYAVVGFLIFLAKDVQGQNIFHLPDTKMYGEESDVIIMMVIIY